MVKLIKTHASNIPPALQQPSIPRRTPEMWSRDLLERTADSWVILDTETTGFGGIDEVIEISVIDGAGQILVDRVRFKPRCDIAPGAQEVHGITLDDLEEAQDFADFAEILASILYKKRIVIYNSQFDLRMLTQTAVIHSCLTKLIFDDVTCAMIQYSEFIGEMKRGGGGYRWQKLPGGDHTSLGDCRAVLELVKQMAGHG